MQTGRYLSIFYVTIQFAAIAVIAMSGPWIARTPVWLALEIAALIPGCWAIAVMLPHGFNITPEPRQTRALITRGPYRYIRHPMYATVLGTTIALVADTPDVTRATAWVVLLVDILFKLHREELLLKKAFPDYDVYSRSTWRLVPMVY